MSQSERATFKLLLINTMYSNGDVELVNSYALKSTAAAVGDVGNTNKSSRPWIGSQVIFLARPVLRSSCPVERSGYFVLGYAASEDSLLFLSGLLLFQ